MSLSENQAIQILDEALSSALRSKLVRFGIGDDAAVLSGPASDQVCTVDSCEEGVHFLWEWMRAADVARKSFHAALSDVAAMGAAPAFVVCHLSLGERVTANWLREFAREQAVCSREVGAPIVGGNVSFSSTTSVVTTVVGHIASGKALLRSGAQVGDEVWLVGAVGRARAGLLLLQERASRARGSGASAAALRAFRTPVAQVRAGRELVGRARACLDVSDGLARDAVQLAVASGVRVVLDADLLEQTFDRELFVLASRLGVSALELALCGGEDYALLATGPTERRPKQCRLIGRVEAASRLRKSGAFLAQNGKVRPLSGGFVHGRRRSGETTFSAKGSH